MRGVIHLDVFNGQVAVFAADDDRVSYLQTLDVDAEPHDAACVSSAHADVGRDGKLWFSLVIKPGATMATWAHECVHIADFFMDRLGIPTDVTNTEVRAYLVAHLFSHLQDLMESTS